MTLENNRLDAAQRDGLLTTLDRLGRSRENTDPHVVLKMAKSGLGPGDHAGSLIVSNGSALTRFGAADGGGQGHLIAISGLEKAPLLAVLYVYNEPGLEKLSRTSTTKIREYHRWGTALSPAAIDQVFADAIATRARSGRMWSPNRGTPASEKDRAVLADRQWEISY